MTGHKKLALYHVCQRVLRAGEVVPQIEGMSHFIKHRVAMGNGELEELFELNRPRACVSRYRAHFAFSSLGRCAAFIKGELQWRANALGIPPDDTVHYYQVEMERPTRAPMALVGHANHHDDPSVVLSIISEYWAGIDRWRWLEYLGYSMRVVKEVSAPRADEEGTALLGYGEDSSLAQRLWPVPT